ncbi:MAG: topoisomerase IV [Firmicutes bacterium]|nr:topoisomerase IV [Bacillota bacterium]
MPYSMSVIMSRALPEIDGLKPSHRKLLYTMYKMGLLKGGRTKSANIVGTTMRLNPHGDGAIYETMVRLTRGNETLLLPYIDSKGNFGKVYSRDMSYAAARYTEAKLEKISEELFKDINKETVDFIPNYDNTTTEPTLLPTTFPNILINPNIGIAVGMACSIPSFNLKEVCETTIKFLESKTGNIDLMKWLPAPDFSTGGELIYNKKKMERIYNTGKGSFHIRGKYTYDEKNNCIDITEIPYTTTAEAIIEKITSLVKSNNIKDITDIRDETDKNGLKITIDLKRNSDPDKLMKILFKKTPLKDSFSCNFNVLINGNPKVLGIKSILKEWVEFRIGCIKRQLRYDIDKKSERLHLLRGLEKILLDIDKAVQIVKDTKKDKEVIPNLMKGFAIDESQAEFIADIKLRNFNQEYILNKTKDIKDLEEEIKDLTETLNEEERIKNIIKEQLKEIIKKYGKDRKTKLVDEDDIEKLTEEQMIEDYNLKIFLSNEGYLKKVPLVSLRGATKQKLKDSDYVIQEIEATNKSELLLFSNKHIVYKLKGYDLEDTKTSNLGDYLPNILGLDEDERIIYITGTTDFKGHMLFFFKNGKCAKIDMSSYETKTNRSKLANAYSNKEPLVYLSFIEEDKEFVAISSIRKVLIFNTDQINPKGTRSSQGVQVLKSKKGSTLKEIKEIDDVKYGDFEYYRGNIPAIGTYLKKEDEQDTGEQIKLV